MDADSFNDLALRDLAGEATPDEQRTLQAEMAAHPGRRAEFAQLQQTFNLLRTAAPMTEAARADQPELPAYRLNELRTAVRQHFGPAAGRAESSPFPPLRYMLRWLFAGSSVAAMGLVVVFALFANRSIEVGLYATDQVRDGEVALAQGDLPAAKLLSFTEDASFDAWQNQPLHWYQHAKVWVDNEHDLLHVVERVRHGEVVIRTLPLAPGADAQRDQIRQVVGELNK